MAASPHDSQRAAARAQRYYWRSARRPSIVGPIALITVGVIALLVETGELNAYQVWNWYVRWWPVLLIAIGSISLGEWWLDRGNPYVGRRSQGGMIALIILLAIIGYTDRGLRGWGGFDGQGYDDFMLHFLGHEHDADSTLNQQIPPRALIEIQVPRGDVTLTPSGDEQVHVRAHEVVYTGNDAEARRVFAELHPRLTASGENVTLRAAAGNSRADLIVEIPTDATATITAGRGDVTVEGLSTPINVTADRGNVKFDSITARAHARISKGDFSAHAIAGDLSAEGRFEDVAISDVQGRVLLQGDFFGDTHLEHIASSVHLHSNRTDIELANLIGVLSLDSGNLQVDHGSGPAKITTNAKDVECTQITGDVSIEDGHAEISLGAAAPSGTITIHNRNGAIRLTVPTGASFQLAATARTGNIQSDFNLPGESVGAGHKVTGKVGSGGPHIELVADHGDIQIGRNDLPVPPAPSGPDEKSMRHLRAPRETNQQPTVLQ